MMKTLKFYLFLVIGLLVFSQPLTAATYITTNNDGTSQIVKKSKSNQEASKELKKQFKQEKKVAKLTKFFSSFGIDFNDPATLLKYGIICCAVGLALWLVGWLILWPIWYVGSLFWTAGVILLIIWFVKSLGV